MPTLQEILENDLGLGSEQEKTASQQNETQSEEIEKLATELGLVDSPSAEQKEEPGLKKEAQMSLDTLYTQLFPQDADVVSGHTKEAAVNKEAAAREEAMGEHAFDRFVEFVDGHIDKLAETLAADAEITKESPGAPDQSLDSNEVTDGQAVDTDPEVQDDAIKDKVPGEVGAVEQKKGPEGELKAAAVRKHLLLSQLEK